jgi:hypothetical protein
MASNNPESEEERWERARKAKQWDENRIRRFEEDQRRKREWINFAEIAEWFSELGGPAKPKKAAAARERAYRMLEQDLLAGKFEEGRRTQVLFRCWGVTRRIMRRQCLQNAIDHNYDGEHGRFYLKHCWLPRKLFERWCAWHHLPKSPPRFQQLFAPAEYCLEGKSPDSIDGVVKANQPTAKSKAKPGAKPRWDWEDIELFVRRELDRWGDFADPQVATKDWQSLSDLYARIITYVEGLAAGSGEGSGPAISTLKDHVPEIVAKWRAQRRK